MELKGIYGQGVLSLITRNKRFVREVLKKVIEEHSLDIKGGVQAAKLLGYREEVATVEMVSRIIREIKSKAIVDNLKEEYKAEMQGVRRVTEGAQANEPSFDEWAERWVDEHPYVISYIEALQIMGVFNDIATRLKKEYEQDMKKRKDEAQRKNEKIEELSFGQWAERRSKIRPNGWRVLGVLKMMRVSQSK